MTKTVAVKDPSSDEHVSTMTIDGRNLTINLNSTSSRSSSSDSATDDSNSQSRGSLSSLNYRGSSPTLSTHFPDRQTYTINSNSDEDGSLEELKLKGSSSDQVFFLSPGTQCSDNSGDDASGSTPSFDSNDIDIDKNVFLAVRCQSVAPCLFSDMVITQSGLNVLKKKLLECFKSSGHQFILAGNTDTQDAANNNITDSRRSSDDYVLSIEESSAPLQENTKTAIISLIKANHYLQACEKSYFDLSVVSPEDSMNSTVSLPSSDDGDLSAGSSADDQEKYVLCPFHYYMHLLRVLSKYSECCPNSTGLKAPVFPRITNYIEDCLWSEEIEPKESDEFILIHPEADENNVARWRYSDRAQFLRTLQNNYYRPLSPLQSSYYRFAKYWPEICNFAKSLSSIAADYFYLDKTCSNIGTLSPPWLLWPLAILDGMQTYIVRSNKPVVDAALQLFKDPSATKKQSAQSKHDLVNFNNWIFIVTIIQSIFVFGFFYSIFENGFGEAESVGSSAIYLAISCVLTYPVADVFRRFRQGPERLSKLKQSKDNLCVYMSSLKNNLLITMSSLPGFSRCLPYCINSNGESASPRDYSLSQHAKIITGFISVLFQFILTIFNADSTIFYSINSFCKPFNHEIDVEQLMTDLDSDGSIKFWIDTVINIAAATLFSCYISLPVVGSLLSEISQQSPKDDHVQNESSENKLYFYIENTYQKFASLRIARSSPANQCFFNTFMFLNLVDALVTAISQWNAVVTVFDVRKHVPTPYLSCVEVGLFIISCYVTIPTFINSRDNDIRTNGNLTRRLKVLSSHIDTIVDFDAPSDLGEPLLSKLISVTDKDVNQWASKPISTIMIKRLICYLKLNKIMEDVKDTVLNIFDDEDVYLEDDSKESPADKTALSPLHDDGKLMQHSLTGEQSSSYKNQSCYKNNDMLLVYLILQLFQASVSPDIECDMPGTFEKENNKFSVEDLQSVYPVSWISKSTMFIQGDSKSSSTVGKEQMNHRMVAEEIAYQAYKKIVSSINKV